MNERVQAPPNPAEWCAIDRPDAIVAIPVCDERERIADCLRALAGQTGLRPHSLGVLLFLNNCRDGTADVVTAMLASLPWPVRIIEVIEAAATAGWARRKAMDSAAEWLERSGIPDGVLLTTDGDSRVGPDWVQRNLHHIAAGADAVAGRISLDPAEAALLPASLHARGRLEARYEALLTELGARLDPDPANPWPCHWTRSGATLAVRCSAYRLVGGMPALANGEDRAFIEALRAADFVVRHATDIEVVTSGRLEGRATGGAADTMRLRCEQPDSPCDDRLEGAGRALARVAWRRYLRHLRSKGRLARTWTWAPAVGIKPTMAAVLSALPSFDQAHAAIEAASPRLAYQPVRPSQLPLQIRLASVLVGVLRLCDRSAHATRPGGTPPFGCNVEAPQIQPTLP